MFASLATFISAAAPDQWFARAWRPRGASRRAEGRERPYPALGLWIWPLDLTQEICDNAT